MVLTWFLIALLSVAILVLLVWNFRLRASKSQTDTSFLHLKSTDQDLISVLKRSPIGVGITIGVFRILKGWPVHWLIIFGYVITVILSFFAPDEIIGIAYDSGGVTTSTITVPLVTALGVGLSSMIRGRNPLIDGFGLIAFASLTPILFVLVFGMLM